MPEYKNQHYVPESYLQGWATSDRVPIYHLASENEYGSQHVSNICSRSYFNSQSPFLEKWLSKLESAHASAFNQIRDGTTLRNLSTQKRRLLTSFVFTQRFRTKMMRDEIDASARNYWNETIHTEFERHGLDTDQYSDFLEFQLEQTVVAVHHQQMMQGILSPMGVSDLNLALLVNRTGEKFVTSDAPIILANPRFKEEYDLHYAGMSNQGLQVYCPLNSFLCLLLYDSEAYSVDSNSNWTVSLSSEKDIRQLNMLQILTSECVIYEDSDRESELRELHNDSEKYRNPVEIPRKFQREGDNDIEYQYQSTHQMHNLTPSLDPVHLRPDLSFGSRPSSGELRQRFAVRKISQLSEYSEEAVARAIQHLLQSAEWEAS